MVLFFLIVVALLGGIYVSSMKSSLDAKAYESAAEKANESANIITQLFDMRLNAVRSTAKFLSTHERRNDVVQKFPILQYSLGLSGFECYAFKWYDKWYTVNKDGYSEKQPYLQFSGLSGRVMFDSLYKDDTQGVLYIHSIYNKEETEIGRIVAKLPADVFWNDLESQDFFTNDDVILTKLTGEILYPFAYKGGRLNPKEVNSICDVKIRYDGRYDGETVNTSGMSVLLSNAVMYVTVGVDNEAVIKSYNETVFFVVIVALLGMLLIGSIVYLCVSRMTRSITELAQHVAQMGAEFDSIPETFTKRRDEAGILSNSFALLLMRLKSALDEKDYIARHDSLTNLKNRYCLEKNILDLIKNQSPFAFGLLDLDDFKVINDTMGHDEGDKLLKNLALVFKSFKAEELLAYRWGGDEFALVIFGDSMQQYEETLNAVMQRVKERFSAEKGSPVTVSIGVSIYPESAATYKDLLIMADKALAWAKMSGKVNFCFFRN